MSLEPVLTMGEGSWNPVNLRTQRQKDNSSQTNKQTASTDITLSAQTESLRLYVSKFATHQQMKKEAGERRHKIASLN